MADRAPPVSQVAEFKDGGGVEGATSGIYQTATGTLSAADGSKSYDKIMSDVRRPSLPLSASQTRADLASDQFKKDMDYTFDDCSKTPFLYSSSSQMLITCATSRSAATVANADPVRRADDDADSFAIKGAVAGNGLMGCSLYAALTQNKDGTLRDAAKKVC